MMGRVIIERTGAAERVTPSSRDRDWRSGRQPAAVDMSSCPSTGVL